MKKQELKLLMRLKKSNLDISVAMFKFLPEPQGHFSFLPTFFKSCDIFLKVFSSFLLSSDIITFKFNSNFTTSLLIFASKPSNRTKASFLNSDNGSFWPYCLRPITCLNCSKY